MQDMAWDETDPLAETGRAIAVPDGIVGTGCTAFFVQRKTVLTYDPVNDRIRFTTILWPSTDQARTVVITLPSSPTNPLEWSKGTPGDCQPDSLSGHRGAYTAVSKDHNSFELAKSECRGSDLCTAVYMLPSGQYNLRYCFPGSRDEKKCNNDIYHPICNKNHGASIPSGKRSLRVKQ